MGLIILTILGGILWIFMAAGIAIKLTSKIVGGDILTDGWAFWYFLLTPTFILLPPALILIATGY